VNKDYGPYQPTPVGEESQQEGLCESWQKALLCIDLQYLNCADNFGVFENHRRSGVSEGAIQYYLSRVNETVVPNVRDLQQYFRKHQYEVIHIRIQSLTTDGRDRSAEHKRLGLHAAPGSRLAEFLPDVAPDNNEIIINKTASGVFVSTNLEYLLRNLCVSQVYVVGVYTNECISSAIRSASDLGFQVYVVSDATAALTHDLHEATLLTTQDRYAKVQTTTEVKNDLQQQVISGEA
jgi:nicotinamidase-related amidase